MPVVPAIVALVPQALAARTRVGACRLVPGRYHEATLQERPEWPWDCGGWPGSGHRTKRYVLLRSS